MLFLLMLWHSVGKTTDPVLKWHAHSPIFHNYFLLSGGEPFSSREWNERGVNVLSDICDDKGLKFFNDLQATYDISGTSFFPLFMH